MAGGQHSTYYDRRYRQGPALIRARRPYLFKNAATGLGLLAVVGGICQWTSMAGRLTLVLQNTDYAADYYTLKAVGQDDFDDVKVPEVPQKAAK